MLKIKNNQFFVLFKNYNNKKLFRNSQMGKIQIKIDLCGKEKNLNGAQNK